MVIPVEAGRRDRRDENPPAREPVAGVDDQGRLLLVEAEGNGSDRPFVSRLTALDARTGTLLYEIPLPGVAGPFEVSRGRIYLSANNELFAIDSSTGAVVWSSDLYGPLRPQLEPFRGSYPLYGVRLEGIVERHSGDLHVLLSGEARLREEPVREVRRAARHRPLLDGLGDGGRDVEVEFLTVPDGADELFVGVPGQLGAHLPDAERVDAEVVRDGGVR